MVRNDITAAANATAAATSSFAEKGNGEAEFMHDAGGNGQVNNTGEPVATGCGTGSAAEVAEGREVRQGVHRLRARATAPTWTQVGATTTIPSAAATQDIGLFVVSHIAGHEGDGQVHRLGAGHRPGAPRADPVDARAVVPAARCPTSSTAPLDTARWTTRARHAHASSGGALSLPVTNGDIDGANQGAISYLGQPAPAGDWRRRPRSTLDAGQRVAVRRRCSCTSTTTTTRRSTFTEALERLALLRVLVGDQRRPHRRTATTSTCPPATPTTIHLRLDATRAARSRRATRTTATAWTDIGRHRAAEGGRQDRPARGGRHRRPEQDRGVRLLPGHAGRRPAQARPPTTSSTATRSTAAAGTRSTAGTPTASSVADGKLAIDDVRRRHQRRQQRPDREPDPPDAARRATGRSRRR